MLKVLYTRTRIPPGCKNKKDYDVNMLKVLYTRTRIPTGCKKKKDHDIKLRYLRPIFMLLTKRRYM